MKRIKRFGCLFLAVVILLGAHGFYPACAGFAPKRIKELQDRLAEAQVMINEGCPSKAIVAAQEILNMAQKAGAKDLYENFIVRALHIKVQGYNQLGEFEQAANTFREIHAIRPANNNTDRVLEHQKLHLIQTKAHEMKLEYLKTDLEYAQKARELFEQQQKLVQALLKGNGITSEQLSQLKKDLQDINVKILLAHKERLDLKTRSDEAMTKWIGDFDKRFRFTEAQLVNQRHVSERIDEINSSCHQIKQEVALGLGEVTRQCQISWAGLEQGFLKVRKIQGQIKSLQNNILSLLQAKKPLSEDEKLNLFRLTAQIDLLTAEHRKTMEEITAGFMSSRDFLKLSDEHQAEFVKNLEECRHGAGLIYSDQLKISVFMAKNRQMLADLNNNGFVESKEVSVILGIQKSKEVSRSFIHLDYNGDGRFDSRDVEIMQAGVQTQSAPDSQGSPLPTDGSGSSEGQSAVPGSAGSTDTADDEPPEEPVNSAGYGE